METFPYPFPTSQPTAPKLSSKTYYLYKRQNWTYYQCPSMYTFLSDSTCEFNTYIDMHLIGKEIFCCPYPDVYKRGNTVRTVSITLAKS